MHNNGLQCSRRGGVPITRGELQIQIQIQKKQIQIQICNRMRSSPLCRAISIMGEGVMTDCQTKTNTNNTKQIQIK